jgi:hypothetical protein
MPMTGSREMTLALARETWSLAEETSQNTLLRLQAAIQALSAAPRQRTLLVAFSGFLTETLEYDQDIIVHQAVRAGVVIDALDSKGLYTVNAGAPELSEINGPLAQPGLQERHSSGVRRENRSSKRGGHDGCARRTGR